MTEKIFIIYTGRSGPNPQILVILEAVLSLTDIPIQIINSNYEDMIKKLESESFGQILILEAIWILDRAYLKRMISEKFNRSIHLKGATVLVARTIPQIRIVTVASDRTDGYERFVASCEYNKFDFVVLGMGEPWVWDLTQSPGGGKKVNLLKRYLDQLESESDLESDSDIILFSDSYDVIVSDSPANVLNKFTKFNTDVLFSAETMIWPDRQIESKFPRRGSNPYIYLNSGGFIGSVKTLRHLTSEPIDDSADDQLYYQKIFLNNLSNSTGNFKIGLDYECEIFQTMSSRFDEIFVDKTNCTVVNKLFPLSSPSIIHGNGGVKSKMHLNSLGNYIPNRTYDNFANSDQTFIPTKTITFIINCCRDNNYTNLFEQTYPADLCRYVFYGSSKPTGLKSGEFRTIASDTDIRDFMIEIFTMYNTDYYFLGSVAHMLTDRSTIKKLMSTGKNIIAPMLRTETNSAFSNFWGDVADDGYYKRSADYLDIVQQNLVGIWNVPYISSSILISPARIGDVVRELRSNCISDEDFDMYFCRILRKKYIFLHIDNRETYGVLC